MTAHTLPQISKEGLSSGFWDILHGRIAAHHDNDLFITKYGKLTTGEANNQANIVYEALMSYPIIGEGGVAVAFEDQLKVVPSLLGTWKANHYLICLHFSNPPSRLRFQLEDTNIKLILTDDSHIDMMRSIAPKDAQIINFDDLDFDRTLPNPEIDFDPDRILQIVYTSGSTGNPKGVIEDYHYLIRAIVRKANDDKPEDRFAMLKGFSFIGPHTTLFSGLITGMQICFYDLQKEGIVGFGDWLREMQVSHLGFTRTMFRNFIQSSNSDEFFPDVRMLGLGAEKKLKDDIELLQPHFPKDCLFTLGFGATEIMAATRSVYPLAHNFEPGILPSGMPYEDIDLVIWDENNQEVPRGEEGQIVIRGDALARGYWNLPKLTEQKFIPDDSAPRMQYYLSGDLGKILPDGTLMHLGRLDHMVKIKGVRIELESIERHMLSYPGIKQVALKTFEDPKNILRLVAYFIAEVGIAIPTSDLRMHLAERISTQMLPHFLVRMENFPLTPSGKIDTISLPLPEMVRPPLAYPYISPQDQIQEKLVAVWEAQLGIDGIGIDDDFFDLGGDSLIASLLIAQIEKHLDTNFPVSILLKAATVRQQAELIRNGGNEIEFQPLIPIRKEGNHPPLIFVPGKGGHPTRIRELAQLLDARTPIYAFQKLPEQISISRQVDREKRIADYVRHIKKFFPNGPYFLLGESGGGKYAFEIARRLVEQGDQVPIVALLDTYNFMKNTAKSRMMSRVAYVKNLFQKHFTILSKSNWKGRVDYINYYRSELLIHLKKITKDLMNKSKHESMDIRLSNINQNGSALPHMPGNYPGRVIMFKALRGPYSDNLSNGWNQVEIGELRIHKLDCYHGALLFEPIVSNVSEILDKYIREFVGEQIESFAK